MLVNDGVTESEKLFTVLRTLLDNGAHVQDTKEDTILFENPLSRSSASTKSRRGSKPEQGYIRSIREGKVMEIFVGEGNFAISTLQAKTYPFCSSSSAV